MQREIKVLKDYANHHIVTLHQLFREKGKLYLVFDYEQRNLLEELQLHEGNGIEPQKIKIIVY